MDRPWIPDSPEDWGRFGGLGANWLDRPWIPDGPEDWGCFGGLWVWQTDRRRIPVGPLDCQGTEGAGNSASKIAPDRQPWFVRSKVRGQRAWGVERASHSRRDVTSRLACLRQLPACLHRPSSLET